MEQRSRLQVVEEIPEPHPTHPDPAMAAGTQALLLGLKALSQRAVAAIDTWFMLLTVASAWWLWTSIPDPNNSQLVALGIYSVFVLAANVIVRSWK